MSKFSSVFANLFEFSPLILPPVRLHWEDSAFRARIAADEQRLEGREYLKQAPPPRPVGLRRG